MPKARLQNKYPLRKQDVKLKKIPQNLSFSDHVALLGDDDLDHRGQRKAVRGELAKGLGMRWAMWPHQTIPVFEYRWPGLGLAILVPHRLAQQTVQFAA